MKQLRGPLALFLLFGVIVAIGAGLGTPALSQPPRRGWEVLIKYEGEKKALARNRIVLRPNVVQKVALFLKTSNEVLSNLKVQLVRLYGEDDEETQAEAMIAKIGPDVAVAVPFEPSTQKDKAPPEKSRDGRLAGAPFKYQIRLLFNGKLVKQLPLTVSILRPYEYMDVEAPLFDKATNHVSIGLKMKPGYAAEPPCEVNLVFEPAVKTTGAQSKAKLSSKEPRGELYAHFPQGAPAPAGRVYVTVDGYARAFMFKSNFVDKGNWPELRDIVRVRLRADRYFNPEMEIAPKADAKGEGKLDPKAVPALKLQIEADGVAGPDAQLEVGFDRDRDEGYAAKQVFPGLREEAVSCAAAPKGMLQFKTTVRDWEWDLDVGGTSGRRQVRLRVLDKANTPVELADEQEPRGEPYGLFMNDPDQLRYAPLTFRKVDKAVYAQIIVDTSRPEGLKLEGPEKTSGGESVALKAWLKRRTEEQAPVTSVEFFLTDPVKEKDPQPIEGTFELKDGKRELWQTTITVPKEAKDKVDVWVKATTATHLSAIAKTTMGLQEKKTVPPAIKGVVTYESRPQAGVRVSLIDKTAKAIDEKKTDAKGAYVFNDVVPGVYRVEALETTFNRKGNTVAVMPPGSTKDVIASFEIR